MPDIETTVENLPVPTQLELGTTSSAIIIGLATYGGADLIHKAVTRALNARETWKVAKELKIVPQDPQPAK